MKPAKFFFAFLPCALFAQETVEVIAKTVERKLRLPGELAPYELVDLHARVNGFVETVEVDRGSMVKKGQMLVRLSAPELQAQLLEIEAKALAIESQKAEAEAKMLAAEATYGRLKEAGKTPGVIAGNELVQAEKAVPKSTDLAAMPNLLQTLMKLTEGDAPGVRATFDRFDQVLGVLALRRLEDERPPVPVDEIEAMIAARRAARQARNFAEADRIRKDLDSRGIVLEDTGSTTRWKAK